MRRLPRRQSHHQMPPSLRNHRAADRRKDRRARSASQVVAPRPARHAAGRISRPNRRRKIAASVVRKQEAIVTSPPARRKRASKAGVDPAPISVVANTGNAATSLPPAMPVRVATPNDLRGVVPIPIQTPIAVARRHLRKGMNVADHLGRWSSASKIQISATSALQWIVIASRLTNAATVKTAPLVPPESQASNGLREGASMRIKIVMAAKVPGLHHKVDAIASTRPCTST